MSEAAKDVDGWPIVVGARVYHRGRGVRGLVERVYVTRSGPAVDVRDPRTGGTRTVRASEVRVQRRAARKAR
jgi:hypothetical protein